MAVFSAVFFFPALTHSFWQLAVFFFPKCIFFFPRYFRNFNVFHMISDGEVVTVLSYVKTRSLLSLIPL